MITLKKVILCVSCCVRLCATCSLAVYAVCLSVMVLLFITKYVRNNVLQWVLFVTI